MLRSEVTLLTSANTSVTRTETDAEVARLGAWGRRIVWVAAVAIAASTPSASLAEEPAVPRTGPSMAKSKSEPEGLDTSTPARSLETWGTLAHAHTGEHLALDATEPSDARFTELLADRVTDSSREIDPRLLGLLRALARNHRGARFEIVSGYRSEKLNEARRKKGRHVAQHSQHTLGQAVDFRLVPRGSRKGLDPRELEREIRALGWDGGVGTYLLESDWFVHADVGKNRRWRG